MPIVPFTVSTQSHALVRDWSITFAKKLLFGCLCDTDLDLVQRFVSIALRVECS
jgi:hypothetical protein